MMGIQLTNEQRKMLNEIFVLDELISDLKAQLQPHDTGHIHTAISVVQSEVDKKKSVLGITNA